MPGNLASLVLGFRANEDRLYMQRGADRRSARNKPRIAHHVLDLPAIHTGQFKRADLHALGRVDAV